MFVVIFRPSFQPCLDLDQAWTTSTWTHTWITHTHIHTHTHTQYLFRHNFSGCGTGFFHTYPDVMSCECEPCSIGTYNDKDFAESCTSCSSGYTTVAEGSTSNSQCVIGNKINISLFSRPICSAKKKNT